MAQSVVPVYNPLRTIVLDRDSPVPLYFQLARHLETEIRSGNLNSGDRLTNEVKIAEELGLSRPTVRASFRYLVDKGLVLRRQGLGTVVTNEEVNRSPELSSLFDDLAHAGKMPTTKVLRNESVKPSDLVKETLGLRDEELVTYLERIRYGDGEPIALLHNFVLSSLPTFTNDALEVHGFYELLRGYDIYPARAVQRISARNATAVEARLLNEPNGSALLTMERTTYDDRGNVFELVQHVYRASRYGLVSTVTTANKSGSKGSRNSY